MNLNKLRTASLPQDVSFAPTAAPCGWVRMYQNSKGKSASEKTKAPILKGEPCFVNLNLAAVGIRAVQAHGIRACNAKCTTLNRKMLMTSVDSRRITFFEPETRSC